LRSNRKFLNRLFFNTTLIVLTNSVAVAFACVSASSLCKTFEFVFVVLPIRNTPSVSPSPPAVPRMPSACSRAIIAAATSDTVGVLSSDTAVNASHWYDSNASAVDTFPNAIRSSASGASMTVGVMERSRGYPSSTWWGVGGSRQTLVTPDDPMGLKKVDDGGEKADAEVCPEPTC
jgi:hypothetical protein